MPMEMPPSRQCSGCGHIHPPPWDDSCPMGKAQKGVANERTQAISSFCIELSQYLQDHPHYKEVIGKLKQLMQKWAK